jgi:hypothetical protein
LEEDSIQFIDVTVISDSISFQIDKSALISSISLRVKKGNHLMAYSKGWKLYRWKNEKSIEKENRKKNDNSNTIAGVDLIYTI